MASGGKMELALDDIIKQNPRGRRGGRGRAGAGGGGSRGGGGLGGGARSSGGGMRRGGAGFSRVRQAGSFTRPGGIPEGPWGHDRFDGVEGGYSGRLRGSSGGVNATAKLLVTNLDYSVSDSDIKELFGEFGPLRRAAVHYDKSARSLGSADVVFERRADAARALKQYNNVPLDGRPMKIQLVDSGSAGSGLRAGGSVFNRVQIGGARANGAGFGRRGMSGGGGGGGRRGRGTGRGGGGGGTRGARRPPPPSIEDLDKELDAYVNKIDSN